MRKFPKTPLSRRSPAPVPPDAEKKDLFTLPELSRKLNRTQKEIRFFIDRRKIQAQRANGRIIAVSWKALVAAAEPSKTRGARL